MVAWIPQVGGGWKDAILRGGWMDALCWGGWMDAQRTGV